MHGYSFSWDDNKDKINIRKHKVSFDEATSVFDDGNAVYYEDEAHSQDEERFIVIGISHLNNMLMVCHCYRDAEKVIRIISARKATKPESKLYGR